MGRGKDDGEIDVQAMLRRMEMARAMGAMPPGGPPQAPPIVLASPMSDYQALWWLAGLIYQARPNWSLKQVQEDTFALAGSIIASWQRGALDRVISTLNEKYGPPGSPKEPPEDEAAEKAPSSPAGEGAPEPDKDPAPPPAEPVAAQP